MRSLAARLELRVPPPAVLLLLGFVVWVASVVLPSPRVVPSAPILVVALAVIGFSLNLIPKLGFLRRGTTLNPMRPAAASSLVTTGLFRMTRNPMYVGHVLLLLSWAIALQSAVGILLACAHVLYLTRFQIIPEERALLRRFPDQYPAYTQATRRWL